ncbi:DUF4232 domain-containing protein [Mycolicibacterium lacusdiani]|uniref:DUF4232 domain-containing protein n=1 Tax=Mycolicibacterium lacusdiani TaxID=2895283 RepID=UPI001F38C43C|nr:DUF4232 domain-containing protein [Mycolicibacterium lacusdiani]
MNTWKVSLPVIAAVLLAGCASEPVTPAASSAPTRTTTAVTTPLLTMTGPCADTDLVVSNAPLESQGSEYRLVLLFENVTSQACTLQGYPGADIVDVDLPAVHVDRRQQIAAPLLTLAPGDFATADLQASGVNRETETPCGTWGQVVVIAPNTVQQRRLDVGMPRCSALISSVT